MKDLLRSQLYTASKETESSAYKGPSVGEMFGLLPGNFRSSGLGSETQHRNVLLLSS